MDPKELTETGITISDWLMMAAVIIGPILAIQVQKFIERKSEDNKRRLQVFKDLMTTRASTLAFLHVSSLNMVGLEFNDKKYSKVLSAWKTYLDHLASCPKNDENLLNIWVEKKNDQLSDLLYEMGVSLGFDFDKVHIKKAGYIPQAYADQENEQGFIRRQIVDIFLGKKTIPMSVESFPSDPEMLESQRELLELMKEHYSSKISAGGNG